MTGRRWFGAALAGALAALGALVGSRIGEGEDPGELDDVDREAVDG